MGRAARRAAKEKLEVLKETKGEDAVIEQQKLAKEKKREKREREKRERDANGGAELKPKKQKKEEAAVTTAAATAAAGADDEAEADFKTAAQLAFPVNPHKAAAKAAAGETELQDQTIKCKDCSQDFIFTAGEQEFFRQKGFTQCVRARCAECTKAKKERYGDRYGSGGGKGGGGMGGNKGGSSSWGSAPTRCYNCGKNGHMSKECPEPQKPTACYHCGKEGHLSRACPEVKPTEAGSGTRCFNCGQAGHMSRDCPSARTAASACNLCGEMGHVSRYCPSAQGKKAPKADKPKLSCWAFQKGECTRGASCHFAHVEA